MTRDEATAKRKQYLDSNLIEDISGCEGVEEAISIAIEALEAQRWISVSEKPKTSGYYNCTCYDGVTNRVTTLKWSNGWMLSGRRAYWKVLAWMPLPKYTEDNDG